MYLPYWIENDRNRYSKGIALLAILLIAIWALCHYLGIDRDFAVQRYAGEAFRLQFLLAPFVHQDLTHVLSNALELFLFGTFVRHQYGYRVFAWLVVPSALLLPFLLSVLGISAIGFSGSLMALAGFVLIAAPQRELRIGVVLLLQNGVMKMPVMWFVVLNIVFDVIGLLSQFAGVASPVSHIAHLLGALYGLTLGWLAQQQKLQFRLLAPAISFWQALPEFFPRMKTNQGRIFLRVCGIALIVFGAYEMMLGYLFVPQSPFYQQGLITSPFYSYGLPTLIMLAGLVSMLGLRGYGYVQIAVLAVGVAFNIYVGLNFYDRLFVLFVVIFASQFTSFESFGKISRSSAARPAPTPTENSN